MDDEPSNGRVLSKDVAISACRWAMTQVLDLVCGKGEIYDIKLPDGAVPEDVAAAVGGTVVTTLVRANGARVLVVRISVGMLVSSLQAEALPTAMFAVEQVATEVGVARVTAPVLKAAVATDAYVPVANAIQKTAPIIGDSFLIKAISKGAAEFNVILAAIDTILNIRAEFRGEHAVEAAERQATRCCDAASDALRKVWSDVPNKFHQASYRTQTGVARFYGQRRSRRN